MSHISPLTSRCRLAASLVSLFLGCLAPHARAAAPTVIHIFPQVDSNYANTGGAYPFSGVTQGSDGDWYGIAQAGGANGAGTLFKMHPDGSGFTTLKTFDRSYQAPDGGYPSTSLTLGKDGALYGSTSNGGVNQDSIDTPGTIFRVSPTGQFQTLYALPANDADPNQGGGASVFQASDGVLYGAAFSQSGVLFRMNTDGTGFQVIHTFAPKNNDGTNVGGSSILLSAEGTDSDLYGIGIHGGAHGDGTVFKVAKDGSGFTVLHNFDHTNPQAGALPAGKLRKGLDGAFYDVDYQGGANGTGGVFRIDGNGNFRQIVSFPALAGTGSSNSVGANPAEDIGLAQGPDGTLYGTTNAGGANGYGTVFAVRPDGSGLADLFDFRASDSEQATAYTGSDIGNRFNVAFGSNGLLYLETDGGGANGTGAVLTLAPPQPAPIHVLWHNTNTGQTALWTVTPDGTAIGYAYPYAAGWTAKALADGPDGLAHVLWNNANGTIALWTVAANGTPAYATFGPYAGLTANALAVGPDSHTHVLWNYGNGGIALWDLAPGAAPAGVAYGPFSGYSAKALAVGPDNHVHVLWNVQGGGIALWDIAPGAAPTGTAYSIPAAYTALALSAGPDNHVHVLWNHAPDSQIALWDIAPGAAPLGAAFGPYSGYSASSLAVGPDNHLHVLWTVGSGGNTLWDIAPGLAPTSTFYNPGSGWAAIAVSAQP